MDVAAIVPTFNRAKLLPETLDSLLGQSLMLSEIVVVDDGSTDETQRVLKRFGSRVRYVRIDNSGPCRARNVGVEHSEANWIAFCDSDDLWLPQKLEKQAELILSQPSLEYCFTNFNFFDGSNWTEWSKFDDIPEGFWPESTTQVGDDHFVVNEPLYGAILQYQPIFVPGLLMTRRFFKMVGGFNESFGRVATEDFEFALRCVQNQPVGVTRVPLFGVRIHSNKHSGDPLHNALGQLKILEFATSHHQHARFHQKIIERKTHGLKLEVAYAAFARRKYGLVLDMLAGMPRDQLDGKMRFKLKLSQILSKWVSDSP